MAASLAGLSASVTRILCLTGFPKELKTKDIQAAFSDYDGQNGGFKIKWRDDTSLLIVFQDATVAKRAYLGTIAFPPSILTSSTTGVSATIKPYDGPDAQTLIQTAISRGTSELRMAEPGKICGGSFTDVSFHAGNCFNITDGTFVDTCSDGKFPFFNSFSTVHSSFLPRNPINPPLIW